MNQTTSINSSTTMKAAREQLKSQITHYIEQQPESSQVLHSWMKRLEAASLGLIAAAFIAAIYISINWASMPPNLIPVAWLFYVASATPAIVLVGLHAVILRAFPPIVLPGKVQKFVTGREALLPGWGLILIGLVFGAFWGLFAYSVWTFNMTMLEPLIRVLASVVGIGMAVAILYRMVQKILKSR